MAQSQAQAQAAAICAIISGMQLDSVARATAAAIQFALPALCLQLNFLWLPLPLLPLLLLLLLQLLSLYLLWLL